MAVKFHIIGRRNPSDPDAPEKYYPSIRSDRRITTNDLAEDIADGGSLTPPDVKGAVDALKRKIKKNLINGDLVDLDELGSISLRIKTTGSDTPEEVSAKNIKSVLVRFIPGKEFKRELQQIEFVLDGEE